MIPSAFIKFAFSFPGMTVWMFCIYFVVNTLFFGYSLSQGATTSAIMSVTLAALFSRNLRKNMPFFAKNIEENRFDLMRRFKKYVQKGELPTRIDEYSEFRQYLEEVASSHAKKSLNSEKIMVGAFGALGVFVLTVDIVQSGLLFIVIAVFFALQVKSSAKARKTIPALKEKLEQLTEK
ncbi:MAG TPA: hypothetical protein VJ843_05075 [Candidatus Saccharimonadales bacterium]|nr:hypothetical protein [Candidatus Saccharimonadales bacterium]